MAIEAAERTLAHLTSGVGYAKFQKPTEQPFNDESQLVLQYFVTGRDGVSLADVDTVPHNTPTLLREATHLSVAALHAAYVCAVWKAFSPNKIDSVLTPRIPRFDHYGLQRIQHTPSGEGSTLRTSWPRPRHPARTCTRMLMPSRDSNSSGTNGTNGAGTSSWVGRSHLSSLGKRPRCVGHVA